MGGLVSSSLAVVSMSRRRTPLAGCPPVQMIEVKRVTKERTEGSIAESCWKWPRREASSDGVATRRKKCFSRRSARRAVFSGGMEMVPRKESMTTPA